MNVIITGASQGIGYELVKLFTQSGDKVLALSRTREKLEKLKNECMDLDYPNPVRIYPIDIVRDTTNGKLISFVKEYFAQVDILVNNAGSLVCNDFDMLSEEDYDNMFNVNVKAVFRLIQILKPLFRKNSHIVNISSMAGFQGSSKFRGLSLYSASKAAVAVLSECLAEEFREEGIKVNSLALGAAQTEMLAKAFPDYQAPLTAKEMASFIFDFARKGHQHFNGKILPVSISTP